MIHSLNAYIYKTFLVLIESQIEHIAMEEVATVLKDPFEDVEKNLGFKLQPSLKKCLIANGFDSSSIISKIDETDIAKTEEFA